MKLNYLGEKFCFAQVARAHSSSLYTGTKSGDYPSLPAPSFLGKVVLQLLNFFRHTLILLVGNPLDEHYDNDYFT